MNRVAYPISASPLFGIPSKRRLAHVLEVDLPSLRALQLLGDKAYILRRSATKPGKKPRDIQDPIPCLKKIHKRLNRLFQRVQYPSFVQAGLKNTSYIKNAAGHSATDWVCTIDIKSFYPNCKRERVYQFFRQKLNCAPDVAQILTDLNTVNGHLPTGGPFSLLLSYWSNQDIFELINECAKAHQIKMTLYVDDLTFSGGKARPQWLNDHVKPILRSAGLVGHKIKSFSPNAPKHITGVVITREGPKVPFKRARKIRDGYAALEAAGPIEQKINCVTSLASRLYEAAQIDCNYKEQADAIQDCLRNLLYQGRLHLPHGT